MAANRRRRRRTATIAATVAAVALTAGLVAGCNPDDVGKSLDCVRNYDTIADNLKAIHEAGLDAAKNPSRTDDSIATIEKNLDKIKEKNDETGEEYPSRGVFVEVIEPEKLVWTEPSFGITSTSTFTDLGDGRTEVHIHQSDLPEQFATPEAREGFNSSLDRFAAYLATL